MLKEDNKEYTLNLLRSLDETINFGKYKGELLQDLIVKDPAYILWCITNVIFFCIDRTILVKEKLRLQKNYLEAVEINLIKLLFLENETSKDYDHNEQISDLQNNYDAYEGNSDSWFHANQ